MKTINFKYIVPCLFAVAFLFSSCSDKDNNLVYFKANVNNTLESMVTHTPIGDFGTVNAKFPVRIQRPAASSLTVTAELDNSLIDAYNKDYGTNCKALPDDVVDFVKMNVNIPRDSVKALDSIEVSIPDSKFSLLTDSTYLLPVRITEVKGDGKESEERGKGYVFIRTQTKLVNSGVAPEDMPGTLLDDYTGWSADYQDSGTPINISDLFNNITNDGLALNQNNGNTIIIDMQSEKKVSGVRMARWYESYVWGDYVYGYGYWFSAVHVWLSKDGDWTSATDAGTVSDSEMSRDDKGFQYIAFYGGVATRYIKLQIFSGYSTSSSLAELGVFVSE
ncbi:MAG: DUF1735 domain-containing protein [Bacteroidales bacterium]|jgi:hypothetical protein|nr:DUF1735 domain-containing protein [Bacteroidales bacterium]